MLRLVILATMASAASGSRSWLTLVNPDVFVVSDAGRSIDALQEGDPFLTRTTFRPTGAPSITPHPTSYPVNPTIQPTVSPSVATTAQASSSTTNSSSRAPTTSSTPSSTPSKPIEHRDGNGICPAAEVLHEVVMFDLFGDGWEARDLLIERLGDDLISDITEAELVDNSHYLLTRTVRYSDGGSKVFFTKYTNSTYPAKSELIMEHESPGALLSPNPIFKEGLAEGDVAIRYACLQPGRCYKATIEGGAWAEEISWEIRQASLDVAGNKTGLRDPIVNGGAPSQCTFSVPSVSGYVPDMYCASECHLLGEDPLQTSAPTSAPVTAVPTLAPVTAAPVTAAPVTAAPVTAAPVTAAPVVIHASLQVKTLLKDLVPFSPSSGPSLSPSFAPTSSPSRAASDAPSIRASESPSIRPTDLPSIATSGAPSIRASMSPSVAPSEAPSVPPTESPSIAPSEAPSVPPTDSPSGGPTTSPSRATSSPSIITNAPTDFPTIEPTWSPTISPTVATMEGDTSAGQDASVVGKSYFDDFLDKSEAGRHDGNVPDQRAWGNSDMNQGS